jgi:hypothetical protein
MTLHPPRTGATVSCGAAEHGVEMRSGRVVLGTGPLMGRV